MAEIVFTVKEVKENLIYPQLYRLKKRIPV
jgi:hypothetical protein